MGIVTFIVNLLLNLMMPKGVSTILALLVALIAYVIAMLKFGALASDEIVALPKGAMIYRLLQKLHLISEEY